MLSPHYHELMGNTEEHEGKNCLVFADYILLYIIYYYIC